MGGKGDAVRLVELNGSNSAAWPAEVLFNTSKIKEKCLPFHFIFFSLAGSRSYVEEVTKC